jgi:hypothetical protein
MGYNDYANDNRRGNLDPTQENQRQLDFQNRQQEYINSQQEEMNRRAVELGNRQANQKLDRSLVLKNQEQAAQNVANQLNNLTTSRRDASNAINTAYQNIMALS